MSVLAAGGREARIHDLALELSEVDTDPPTLEIVSPVAGSKVRRQPRIVVRYADAGSGVEAASLALRAHGLELETSCRADAEVAS